MIKWYLNGGLFSEGILNLVGKFRDSDFTHFFVGWYQIKMPSEIKPPLVLVGKSTKVKKLLKHNKLVLPAYNGLRLLCSMHYSSSIDNSIDRKAALGLEIETKGSQLST